MLMSRTAIGIREHKYDPNPPVKLTRIKPLPISRGYGADGLNPRERQK
jgi:hypothetical protein